MPIDFLGGVSMGSLVAACHAFGFLFPGTIDTLPRTFVDTRPHRGYTVPLVSVFSPRKTEKALHYVFGDTPIEDLWINYFCVAANLTRATVHVFRRGPVWKAMRASGSFPGLLLPVPHHGDLLVDGGVLDNLPVELMQTLCPGPVLVSDTSQDVDLLRRTRCLEWSPSAAELLLERLRPVAATRVPGAATVLLRALECHQAGHRRRQRAGAAFVFDLPVGRYGLIDFPSIDPIVEAGYRYATTAIDALPPAIPRTRGGARRGFGVRGRRRPDHRAHPLGHDAADVEQDLQAASGSFVVSSSRNFWRENEELAVASARTVAVRSPASLKNAISPKRSPFSRRAMRLPAPSTSHAPSRITNICAGRCPRA